jgi:hypothetical protein
MTKGTNPCNIKELGRFFDQELGPADSVRMREHVEKCDTCAEELRDNAFVSSLLRTGLEGELSRANFQEVENTVTALFRAKRTSWWIHFKDICFSKRLYVPAAVVTAMLVMLFYFARAPAPAHGPSAIVDSLQGDFASVMILETQKSRQTILWIYESADVWENGVDPMDQTGLGPFFTRYCLILEKPGMVRGETFLRI